MEKKKFLTEVLFRRGLKVTVKKCKKCKTSVQWIPEVIELSNYKEI
jgi:hypothetical protein